MNQKGYKIRVSDDLASKDIDIRAIRDCINQLENIYADLGIPADTAIVNEINASEKRKGAAMSCTYYGAVQFNEAFFSKDGQLVDHEAQRGFSVPGKTTKVDPAHEIGHAI